MDRSSKCPQCRKGHVVMIDSEGGAVPYDFECSRCDWICADAERAKAFRAATRKQTAKKKHPKRIEINVDSPELVQAIRDECNRRAKALLAERKKYPPTFIKKGKTVISNPHFTEKMRQHMHKFAYSAEEIRQELIANA